MALSEPQQALADAMSDISEYCWFASWLTGTEYRLWQFMTDPTDEASWGNYPIPPEHRDQLRALSASAGGWIVWRDSEQGPAVLSFADWQPLFDAWRQSQEATEGCRVGVATS